MKQAVFVRHNELIPGVFQSFFKPESRLQYVAGQYCELLLPEVHGDPRGLGRTFTLTSLPTDELVSFIYRADEPMSPFKQVLLKLRPGAAAQLGDVMGDLVLPRSPAVPLVFVAGGLGMASFTAMLRELNQERTMGNSMRGVSLFYALRGRYDDAFRSQVDSFPFASRRRFVAPERLNAADIMRAVTPDSLVYLSGSEKFVSGLRDSLHAAGLGHQQLIFDFFEGYTDL